VSEFAISSVPTLRPVTVGAVKVSGRNSPIAMQCSSGDGGEPREYVVKLYGNLDLGVCGLARELFAALLGQGFGLPIPPAAIVDVPEMLSSSVRDPIVQEALRRSPGFNFGSQTAPPGFKSFLYIPSEHQQLAADIFAFDVLIRNPDRMKERPNIFQANDGFIVFDHETAFPYAVPKMFLPSVPEPWSLSRNDVTIKQHVFYAGLRGKPAAFDGFIAKLQMLSDDCLDSLVAQIPPEWRPAGNTEVEHICAYLRKGRDCSDRLHKSLMEVLA
jgi:hypothetical protein